MPENDLNPALISHRLEQLEHVTEQSSQNVMKLLEAIKEQSSQIAVMIERHDRVSGSNVRLWTELGTLKDQVKKLELSSAEDRPIITGIKSINRQIMILIVTAVMGAIVTPAAVLTYFLNSAPAKAEEVKHVQKQAPRDPQQ